MIRRAIRLFLLVSLAVSVSGGALEAQGRPGGGGRPLRVDARQGLDFGALLGGVPQVVQSNDPVSAARIQISGQGGSDVLVSFLLPLALDGPAGASVPLVFGAGIGGYSATEDIDSQVSFDPGIPTIFGLSQSGRGMIYLGGTALPPIQAPAGAYSATVTLTISYVGN